MQVALQLQADNGNIYAMGRETKNYRHERYSPEVIRKYEDPEYAKAAEAYEREARMRRAAASRNADAGDFSSGESYGYTGYANQRGYGQDYTGIAGNDQYGDLGGRSELSASERRAARREAKHDKNRNRSYVVRGRGRSREESVASLTDPEAASEYYGGGGRRSSGSGGSGRNGGYSGNGGNGRTGGSGSAGGKRGGKKKKRHVVRNILLIIVALIIALMAFLMSITSNLDRVDVGKDFAISKHAARSLAGYRNILILGSDARAGEGLDGSRSDAIIILSINRLNSDIRMISVMRDSYLKFKLYDGELGLDKLTHAHAFGGGLNTVQALNRSLDLNIKEFVIFDWKAVADTVDTLGGIEVDVKKKEIGDLNKWGPESAENVGTKWHKVKKPGKQTLDGAQAVTYCRIRKNSGGDTGRGNRYKTVMAAVMKKAAKNPLKMQQLSKKVMPQVRTNMSQVQLAQLVARAPMMDSEMGISWPKKYYGGLVNGVWYAVPTTLESNVKWLHKKAFGQEDYELSEECSSINDEIINNTGYY